jgi:type IV pilus assembly protein PilQ
MMAHNVSERGRRLGIASIAAVAASGIMLSAAAAPVRLVGVSAQINAVLIEATAPVPYAVSRPDPLTLLVDLRGVSATEARADVPRGGHLAGVTVEQAAATDGTALARIRVALNSPSGYRVRSARNTIRLELSPAADADAGALPRDAQSIAADLADPGPATILEQIRSRRTPSATTVTLSGNGQLAPSSVAESADSPRRLLLDFPRLTSRPDSQQTLDSDLVPRVRIGMTSRDPVVTRVALELSESVTYHIERSGPAGRDLDVVVERATPRGSTASESPPFAGTVPADSPIALDQPIRNLAAIAQPEVMAAATAGLGPVAAPGIMRMLPSRSAAAARAQAVAVQPPAPAPDPAPVLQQQPGAADAQRRFTGHPISLDFQGADLRAVLRGFSEISGLNMVIDPDVQGTVDIILNEVPWDQALDVILRGNGLDYTVDGTIVRIARIDTLRKEQDARQALAKSAADAGTLEIRTFTLSYARASAAAPLVKRAALSARGDVQIDDRTNTLIITDLPAKLDTVNALLATIDRPERQVEIEARIITTTREFARAIGIQWGLNGRMTPELGNTTNLAFPNSGSISGRAGGEGSTTAVNLPAVSPGSQVTSAIGLALGAVNGAFSLDIALSALEHSGKGRILSTPRVTTQNNVEAEITQGVQIPVTTPSTANTPPTTTYKDAALTLKVLPQITNANTVIMNIQIENSSPGIPVPGGIPINTQRAITRVQVADGITTVVGGVIVANEQSSTDRTPFLYRMPLLGYLFQRDNRTDDSRELLVFITPRILRD